MVWRRRGGRVGFRPGMGPEGLGWVWAFGERRAGFIPCPEKRYFCISAPLGVDFQLQYASMQMDPASLFGWNISRLGPTVHNRACEREKISRSWHQRLAYSQAESFVWNIM